MIVGFALLAEYVTESYDGKLSISGIFDEIYAPAAPFVHPRMFTAVRLEGRVTEGTEHTVQLVIVDEDGHEIITKSPPIPVALKPSGPGMPLRSIVVTELVGIRFPRFGDYEFNVFVDERPQPLASVAFSALLFDE